LLAIGYRFPGSSTWTFVHPVAWQGDHWHSGPMYMAQYLTSGQQVDLRAIVISNSALYYYVNISAQAYPGATFWDSAGLPPSIIFETPVQYAYLPSHPV
jgi:hypothetical protein